MKVAIFREREGAVTWLEVLLVVGIIAVFVVMIFTLRSRQRATGRPVWEGDNNDKYPMPVPRVNNASTETTNAPITFRYQQVISNELSESKEIISSKETEKARSVASNSVFLSDSNINYFTSQ